MAWQEFGFGRGPLTEGYLGGGMGGGGRSDVYTVVYSCVSLLLSPKLWSIHIMVNI